MSITQEDIDALHQSPRSANDSDVTELCEKIAELQAECSRLKEQIVELEKRVSHDS